MRRAVVVDDDFGVVPVAVAADDLSDVAAATDADELLDVVGAPDQDVDDAESVDILAAGVVVPEKSIDLGSSGADFRNGVVAMAVGERTAYFSINQPTLAKYDH